jgi:hypothetical protein
MTAMMTKHHFPVTTMLRHSQPQKLHYNQIKMQINGHVVPHRRKQRTTVGNRNWSTLPKKGENGLLGGFPAEVMDKDAFISKCILKEVTKHEFDCDPKSISHIEKLPFETESLFKDDSNDDKISFSWDDNAEAWSATEVSFLSGKCTNKRPLRSAAKRAKKCSKKQKQAHTAKKGEHALIGGFTADDLHEEASIWECMLGNKLKLEFSYDPKLIRKLEMFPFETGLFNDDSNNDWWTRTPTTL